jgi:hypothetical protein
MNLELVDRLYVALYGQCACKIWVVMQDECIPTPNEEKWLEIAESYQQRAQFPHCIGAIDGKHIEVIKPRGSTSQYFNYKNFFSVVLLAVDDSIIVSHLLMSVRLERTRTLQFLKTQLYIIIYKISL